MSHILVAPAGYRRAMSFAAALLLSLMLAGPAEASGSYDYSYPYDYGYNNNYYSQGTYGGTYDGSYYNNYYGDNYFNGYYDYNTSGYYDNYHGGYGYGRRPTCSMTLTYDTNNSTHYYNSYMHSPATLTWTTWNATSGTISPDVGSVGRSGSRTVYPYGQQTYTMTVYGQGGSNTCQVTAVSPYISNYFNQYPYYYNTSNFNYSYPYNYGSYYNYTYPTSYTYPTYTPAYTYPATSYIALDKVPYTGDGFGPLGTMLAWFSVALAAGIGATYLGLRLGLGQKILAPVLRSLGVGGRVRG